MTDQNEMPGVIYAVPYEDMAHGEWDETKWIKCPFVENDKRPKYETKYHSEASLLEAIEGMKRDTVHKWNGGTRDGNMKIREQNELLDEVKRMIEGRK